MSMDEIAELAAQRYDRACEIARVRTEIRNMQITLARFAANSPELLTPELHGEAVKMEALCMARLIELEAW